MVEDKALDSVKPYESPDANLISDAGSRFHRRLGAGILIAGVVFAVIMRINSSGWTVLLYAVPNLLVLIFHSVIASLALLSRPSITVTSLIALASALLILGIGLQRDFGDGYFPWIVIVSFLYRQIPIPTWWPLPMTHLWYDFLLLIPLAISWVAILVGAFANPKARVVDSAVGS